MNGLAYTMTAIGQLLEDAEKEANASSLLKRGSSVQYNAVVRSIGLMVDVKIGPHTNSVFISWVSLEQARFPNVLVRTTLLAAHENIENQLRNV